MAYSYHRRRGAEDGGAGVIMLILIAGTLYAHRASLVQIEMYATAATLVTALLVVCVAVFRVIRRTQSYARLRYLVPVGIDSMSGLSFERYVAGLLKTRGYSNVRLTEEYDYGVDIIADKDGIRWGIQVKRYTGLVKAEAVRQVVTALNIYGCDRAMVITNSYYSHVARRLAESNNCVLVDREGLRLL